MTTHTTPLPRADQASQSGHADKPDRRASRFDQRGIALQTVIIMVVLLAIAGGIAAVLLNRGSQATSQLEAQQLGIASNRYDGSRTLCESGGHDWVQATSKCRAKAGVLVRIQSSPECAANNGTWKPSGGSGVTVDGVTVAANTDYCATS